jgi:hypothetical protein
VTARPEFEPYATNVAARLKGPSWRRADGVVSDPEVRKLVGRIYTAIGHAERLFDEGAFDDEAARRVHALLEIDPATIDGLDLALEITDRWDQLLIEVGDADYLCTLLEVELARIDTGTTAVTWDTLYGELRPEAWKAFMEGKPVDSKGLDEVRRRLAALYRTRLVLYSLYRSRLQMKRNFLLSLAPVLIVLVALFAAGIALLDPGSSLRELLLAVSAGALGAAMSGTFKLRDEISHVNDLRGYKPVIVIQPILGAAAALFAVLVLETGLIQIGDDPLDWATLGVISFVAGFSEPFVLGLVHRVTGLADEEPAK